MCSVPSPPRNQEQHRTAQTDSSPESISESSQSAAESDGDEEAEDIDFESPSVFLNSENWPQMFGSLSTADVRRLLSAFYSKAFQESTVHEAEALLDIMIIQGRIMASTKVEATIGLAVKAVERCISRMEYLERKATGDFRGAAAIETDLRNFTLPPKIRQARRRADAIAKTSPAKRKLPRKRDQQKREKERTKAKERVGMNGGATGGAVKANTPVICATGGGAREVSADKVGKSSNTSKGTSSRIGSACAARIGIHCLQRDLILDKPKRGDTLTVVPALPTRISESSSRDRTPSTDSQSDFPPRSDRGKTEHETVGGGASDSSYNQGCATPLQRPLASSEDMVHVDNLLGDGVKICRRKDGEDERLHEIRGRRQTCDTMAHQVKESNSHGACQMAAFSRATTSSCGIPLDASTRGTGANNSNGEVGDTVEKDNTEQIRVSPSTDMREAVHGSLSETRCSNSFGNSWFIDGTHSEIPRTQEHRHDAAFHYTTATTTGLKETDQYGSCSDGKMQVLIWDTRWGTGPVIHGLASKSWLNGWGVAPQIEMKIAYERHPLIVFPMSGKVPDSPSMSSWKIVGPGFRIAQSRGHWTQ